MKPRLAGSVIALGVDRFIVNVGEVTAQANNFLRQAVLRGGHEVSIAPIPELAPVSDCSGDTAAVRLDSVFCYEFGVEWRQLTMPIDDSWSSVVIRCAHKDTVEQ